MLLLILLFPIVVATFLIVAAQKEEKYDLENRGEREVSFSAYIKEKLPFTIIIVLVVLFLFQNSVIRWELAAEKYVENNYIGEFALSRSYAGGGTKEFQFITEDENQIKFTIYGWWGGIPTPWGELDIFPVRHFRSELSDSLNKYIIDEKTAYDITGKSVSEIKNIILEQEREMQELYDFYGNKDTPTTMHYFRYNDVITAYTYSSETLLPDNLDEDIYETLIAPNCR